MMIATVCLYYALVLESVSVKFSLYLVSKVLEKSTISPPLIMSHHSNHISQIHCNMTFEKFNYRAVKIYHTTSIPIKCIYHEAV